MAKQRDDRRDDDELPKKKKGRPDDEIVDDLEIVEEAEEAEIVDEPPTPPRRAGHTILGKPSRQSTMLGKPDEEEPTPPSKRPEVKKTQIAPRDVFAEPGQEPANPKKTQLAKQANPTMLGKADDDDEVLDAVIADDEVLEAQPASGVIEADFADTPPGGGHPKQPASEVIRGEPISSVSRIQPVSEVIRAEPLSDLSRVEPVEAEDVLSGDVKDRGPNALPESTVPKNRRCIPLACRPGTMMLSRSTISDPSSIPTLDSSPAKRSANATPVRQSRR